MTVTYSAPVCLSYVLVMKPFVWLMSQVTGGYWRVQRISIIFPALAPTDNRVTVTLCGKWQPPWRQPALSQTSLLKIANHELDVPRNNAFRLSRYKVYQIPPHNLTYLNPSSALLVL